jgi:multisubunit Na+/H+ antiporter MnhF subunit
MGSVVSSHWIIILFIFLFSLSFRQEPDGAGGFINTILTTVHYHMINSWLVTVFCLVVLSLCAVVRVIPGPARDDRFVALNTAITLAAGAALGLSIYWGNIVLLDISLVLVSLGYAAMIAMARSAGSEKA